MALHFGLNRKTVLAAGVTALLMCASSLNMEVWGQRTMRGESFISAEVHDTFQPPYGRGADLSYGQYLLGSYWKAGIFATGYTLTLDDGTPMEYIHAGAYGEWMYRLTGTRSRALNLYGGGGVFLGYEAEDPRGLLGEWEKPDMTGGSFLYGIRPSLEAELFITRRIAVIISGSAPINFTSAHGWLHCQAGAGLRINL